MLVIIFLVLWSMRDHIPVIIFDVSFILAILELLMYTLIGVLVIITIFRNRKLDI